MPQICPCFHDRVDLLDGRLWLSLPATGRPKVKGFDFLHERSHLEGCSDFDQFTPTSWSAWVNLKINDFTH